MASPYKSPFDKGSLLACGDVVTSQGENGVCWMLNVDWVTDFWLRKDFKPIKMDHSYFLYVKVYMIYENKAETYKFVTLTK